jgi:transposase-like protein
VYLPEIALHMPSKVMKISDLQKRVTKSKTGKNKWEIVEEIRSQILTYQEASQKYSIPAKVLRHWNRQYYTIRLHKFFKSKVFRPMTTKDQQLQQLQRQLKDANALIDQLSLKNTTLETLTTVAEKELKIDIRKKSGSKLFKK